MRAPSIILVLSSMLVTTQSTIAASDDGTALEIKTKLEARFQNIRIDSVAKTNWNGIYEVVTGGQLAYVNEDASLLFAGKILDTQTKEDLTVRRWNELNRIDVASLPLASAIKTVKGDGSRTLIVFADPLCPYCRELEQQMTGLADATVYTFLYPLEAIHPGATALAGRIWCASNRSEVWAEWMVQGAQPPTADSCDRGPLAEIKQLGERLKINSTPTLYFADGHRVSGALDNRKLEREFAAAASHAASSSAEAERDSK